MTSARAQTLAAQGDDALASLLARADAAQDSPLGDAYLRRRVADVLAHLHSWHVLFEGWVDAHRAGLVPEVPAHGYTWGQLEALNSALYERHRHDAYDVARDELAASHERMKDLLDTFTERELTEPGVFPWLGDEALGDSAHECLAGHYAWAQGVFDAAGLPE